MEEACCISHLFFKAAACAANKIAVIHAIGGICSRENEAAAAVEYDDGPCPPVYLGDIVYTYSELLGAVNSLASRLSYILAGGHDPDLIVTNDIFWNQTLNCLYDRSASNIIGICIYPSAEYIVAVLAVLRCGRVFLPIDPSLPPERIHMLLCDSKVCLVLTCHQAFGICAPEKLLHDLAMERNAFPLLSLPEDYIKRMSTHECDLTWPCQNSKQREFCYVLYTSGSTGTPKGVCGTEKGLLNRFHWMESAYPSKSYDIYCFKAAVSFIDHLSEIFQPLLSTSTLVIPSVKVLKENFFILIKVLKAYHITRLTIIPSVMQALFSVLKASSSGTIHRYLRILVLSGETFTIGLWRCLHETFPNTSILNLYGSTEVSGDCAYFDCKDLPTLSEYKKLVSVPIGKPIPGCEMLLSKEGEALDQSTMEGEIWVGGNCCAAKYLNDLSSKSSKFVMLHQSERVHHLQTTTGNKGKLFFKTGDLAKKLNDGNYVFIGRNDRVVKIHGQRVSFEEIEYNLTKHPLIEAAVVSSSLDTSHINAYIVLKVHHNNLLLDDKQNESEQLPLRDLIRKTIRNWLKDRLPTVMIPSNFFFVSSVPLLTSGKIDYQALSQNSSNIGETEDDVTRDAKDKPFIDIIKEAFSAALKVSNVENDQDFFSLGGNSISAAHAAHKLGIDMHLIYQHPSSQKLHDAIRHIPELRDRKINMFAMDLPINAGQKEDNAETRPLQLFESSKSVSGRIGFPNYNLKCNEEKTLSSEYTLCQKKTEIDHLEHSNFLKRPQKRLHILTKNKVGREKKNRLSELSLPDFVAFTRSNNTIIQREQDKYLVIQNSCLPIRTSLDRNLEKIWKVSLQACVDASPLLVKQHDGFHLYIGSHAHKFMCIDANSGVVKWSTDLGGRIESTATITQDFSQVVVGCYDGAIYFLDSQTGCIVWRFQTSAEVKSQPVVDMLRGWIWCGSHDHHLYALDSQKQICVYKYACGGSIFGAPAYDQDRDIVYVVTTRGRILAFGIMGTSIGLSWFHECGSPVFASVTIESSTGYVFCCTVNGSVIALSSTGSCIWETSINGPIFAGACISFSLPSQVIVGARNGFLYAFNVNDGNRLWMYAIEEPITSSAYVDDTVSCLVQNTNQPDISYRFLCICSSSGSIFVLQVTSIEEQLSNCTLPEKSESLNAVNSICKSTETSQYISIAKKPAIYHLSVCEYAKIKVSGDIFSSPVMIGGYIFVGCRDDHVYCVDMSLDKKNVI